jgi:chorismate mutase
MTPYEQNMIKQLIKENDELKAENETVEIMIKGVFEAAKKAKNEKII